jgi:hypothetical protein
MSSKMYTVAGTSNINGVVKARFANNLAERVALLEKNGQTEINLIELPHAMSKEDASKHLATLYTEGTPEYAAVTGKLDSIAVKARRVEKRNALKTAPKAKTAVAKSAKTPVVQAKSASAKRVRPSRSKAAVAAREAAVAEAIAQV